MMLAILLLQIFACLLLLVLATGCVVILINFKHIKADLSKTSEKIDILERIDRNISKLCFDLQLGELKETKTTWVAPKKDKPKVIRRTEADEFEMEKPLGERRI